MSEAWVFFGTVISAVPQCVNKETGLLEYAAVQVTRNGPALSYTPGVISVVAKLPTAATPRFSQGKFLLPHAFHEVQHIVGGRSFKAFKELFDFIELYQVDWARIAVQMVPDKKKAG